MSPEVVPPRVIADIRNPGVEPYLGQFPSTSRANLLGEGCDVVVGVGIAEGGGLAAQVLVQECACQSMALREGPNHGRFCVPPVCQLSQTGQNREIRSERPTSHKCQRITHLRHLTELSPTQQKTLIMNGVQGVTRPGRGWATARSTTAPNPSNPTGPSHSLRNDGSVMECWLRLLSSRTSRGTTKNSH